MPESAFLEHLEEGIFKIFMLGASDGGVFESLKYIPVCPKDYGYVTALDSYITWSKVLQFHHFANVTCWYTCVSMSKSECAWRLKLQFLTFTTSFDIIWYTFSAIFRNKSSVVCHSLLLFSEWPRGRSVGEKMTKCGKGEGGGECQKFLFSKRLTFWITPGGVWTGNLGICSENLNHFSLNLFKLKRNTLYLLWQKK